MIENKHYSGFFHSTAFRISSIAIVVAWIFTWINLSVGTFWLLIPTTLASLVVIAMMIWDVKNPGEK